LAVLKGLEKGQSGRPTPCDLVNIVLLILLLTGWIPCFLFISVGALV
jgi:hypothetical protein